MILTKTPLFLFKLFCPLWAGARAVGGVKVKKFLNFFKKKLSTAYSQMSKNFYKIIENGAKNQAVVQIYRAPIFNFLSIRFPSEDSL